jgi:hypothetical protein
MLHTDWLIPLALIAYSGAWLVQRPVATGGIMLAVVCLLSPFYIDRTSTGHIVEIHLFWNAVAVIVGSMLGGHLVAVLRMPQFVQERDLYVDRQIAVRAALLMAALVGSSLCWALVPVPWLNWLLALLIYNTAVVVCGVTFRTGHHLRISTLDVARAHVWLFVCSTAAIVPLGVGETLCADSKVPMILLGTVGGLTAVLSVFNAGLLPNDAPLPPPVKSADEERTSVGFDTLSPATAHEALRRMESGENQEL